MLRITLIGEPNAAPTLKLEGKLLGPWVAELRHTCTPPSGVFSDMHLDLAAITFVDAAGADLLRELLRQGIQIAACSGYVAELLHVEKR